ncbi:hypothetical protein GGR54DRAFT_210836 [Hypoxylon sp. NC1633]|nr:hypothetical protein GGR54DRAFT_210836 [Hypoxylon sp. NC1633]
MMRQLAIALCVFVFAAWTVAAPVVILDKVPNHQSDAASTHARHAAQQTGTISRPKLLLPFFTPSRVSTEKHVNILVTEDGRRVQLPDNLAGARAWETPNVLHFLTSLTRPRKHSPFPESSIMREETRANTGETEPHKSIVELETQAERESWTYVPYISRDNVLRFHCVRKAADKVMLAVPLSAAAIVLVTLIWTTLRHIFRTLGPNRKGAIWLEDGREILATCPLKVVCEPYRVVQHVATTEPSQRTVDEKSEGV